MNNIFTDVGITLPTLTQIEDLELNELQAVAKFRHHESGWEWYVIAGDEKHNDMLLYCYVKGLENEFGHALLSTLLENGVMFCPTFQACKVNSLIK